MIQLELLAPAKDAESAFAAVDHGADAIYIGGPRFGARYAAANTVEQIARVAEYAHKYGVRLHVALNTLLYDDEIFDAFRTAQEVLSAGADALIVQDMAYRRMKLDAELHASTQMCNMTPEKAKFLHKCGFSRIVLERALSLDEIKIIRAATDAELECFIHGSICVGCSCLCYLSRSMSSRSGNRGECSQPCRLTYDLMDDRGNKLISNRHLLSVRDLNLSSRLEDLIDAGVTSFKIEGRLKDIGYVKNIVSFYSRELDRIIARRGDCRRASSGHTILDFEPDTSKSFSRGESEYLFSGRTAGVASFETPKSVGEYIGRVSQVYGKWFMLDRLSDLAAGDGICFVAKDGMSGTNVNVSDGRRIEPNRMDGIEPGVEIYRNCDRSFNMKLERSRTRRVIPCTASVSIGCDEIVMTFVDADGFACSVMRDVSLEAASSSEKMADTVKTQVSKSGDTIFSVGKIEVFGAEWFVQASVLSDMRREGLAALLQKRLEFKPKHKPLVEDTSAEYPDKNLIAEDNVTNRMAAQFYRDHGVSYIERGLDLEETTSGHRVMTSGYCIRREIGECLVKPHSLDGDLFMEHGTKRYKLCFDCKKCEMSVVDM